MVINFSKMAIYISIWCNKYITIIWVLKESSLDDLKAVNLSKPGKNCAFEVLLCWRFKASRRLRLIRFTDRAIFCWFTNRLLLNTFSRIGVNVVIVRSSSFKARKSVIIVLKSRAVSQLEWRFSSTRRAWATTLYDTISRLQSYFSREMVFTTSCPKIQDKRPNEIQSDWSRNWVSRVTIIVIFVLSRHLLVARILESYCFNFFSL